MLQELFRTAAVNHRSKTAVIGGERSISHGELQQAAAALARALHESGARAGDRVAVKLPNGVDAAISIWGVLEAGCVLIPVHAGLRGEALNLTLQDADPHWLIERPHDIQKRVSTSDEDSSALAALLYTSGSTGEPKGVMLTHANMEAALRMVTHYLRITAADVIHSALPLSSSYGLYQLLMSLAAGATVVLDPGFAFPASCLASVARHRATVMAAVPTMLGWMAETPVLAQHDLSSLRLITSAAAALPPAHSLRLRDRLPHAQVCVMYGQTECKRISWLDPHDLPTHPDSVGRGLDGQQHRIVTENGADAATGELGELLVRGPHVMQGYWRKPAETAARLQPADDGGLPWLRTGDAFRKDEEGFLYFSGRRDEILKIGGHKVSPAEIENLLCRIPGVVEAAVVGMSDPTWGEVAVAYMVKTPDSPLSEEDVRRFCSQQLRGFMVPRVVRFEQELPKSASGKILKRALHASTGC